MPNTVQIHNNGTWNFQVNRGIYNPNGASNEFLNYGTVNKAGTGESRVDLVFSNRHLNSKLNVNSGSLYFTEDGFQVDGNTKVASGATLAFSTEENFQTVEGTYAVIGGTFDGRGAGTFWGHLSITDAIFYVGGQSTPGTFTVTGNYTQRGAQSSLQVGVGFWSDKLVVDGTVSLGGNLFVIAETAFATTIIEGTRDGRDFDSFTWFGAQFATDLSEIDKYKLIQPPVRD